MCFVTILAEKSKNVRINVRVRVFDYRFFQEVKQHALRLLQCRLLLLSHASKCTAQEGGCQLSPLCDSVRQLLDHMQHCRDRCVRVVPIKSSGLVDSSPAITPCVTLYLPDGSSRARLVGYDVQLCCWRLILFGEREGLGKNQMMMFMDAS